MARKKKRYKLVLRSGQHPLDDAKFAFAAAKYHRGELKSLMRDGLLSPDARGRLHRHFRGFFWELFAAHDCLHSAKTTDGGAYRRYAEKLDGVEWFEQVCEYRNHLHQSTYVLEVLKASGKVIAVQLQPLSSAQPGKPHGPGGDAIRLSGGYLSNMRVFLMSAPAKP